MVELFEDAINTTKEYTESGFFLFDKKTGTIVDYDALNGPLDVVIPEKIDGVKVIRISNTAFSDKGLTSLVLQENLETLINGTYETSKNAETGKLTDIKRTGAFYNNHLTEITLPNSMKNIGERAFMYNDLTEVVIPDNVKSLNQGAFKGNKLEKVTIGTGVKTIGPNVFENNFLKELYIPENVTSLGTDFILGNKELEKLYLPVHLKTAVETMPKIAKINVSEDGELIYPEIIYYD